MAEEEFQVIVSKIDGSRLVIEVRRSDTIASVKERIADKVGLLPCQQRIVYYGKETSDEQTLAFWNVQEYVTLTVVPRQRGD